MLFLLFSIFALAQSSERLKNLRLKQANKALLLALETAVGSSAREQEVGKWDHWGNWIKDTPIKGRPNTEVQVGETECKDFPPPTCNVCEGVMDFCNGKKYVIKKYTTFQYSALFGCKYPEEYEYVDICPSTDPCGHCAGHDDEGRWKTGKPCYTLSTARASIDDGSWCCEDYLETSMQNNPDTCYTAPNANSYPCFADETHSSCFNIEAPKAPMPAKKGCRNKRMRSGGFCARSVSLGYAGSPNSCMYMAKMSDKCHTQLDGEQFFFLDTNGGCFCSTDACTGQYSSSTRTIYKTTCAPYDIDCVLESYNKDQCGRGCYIEREITEPAKGFGECKNENRYVECANGDGDCVA